MTGAPFRARLARLERKQTDADAGPIRYEVYITDTEGNVIRMPKDDDDLALEERYRPQHIIQLTWGDDNDDNGK